MRYYIIAGEASGDLHGSNLIKAIKAKDPNAVIQCWGGDLMEAAGGKVVKHYRTLAFMGFVEVLMNLPTILSNIKFCKKDIAAFAPDVLICIDYPGFNLRIAKWAKSIHLKVIYFIAPQVWAWKENRVPAMRASIDRLLCILPFEKQYFKDRWNWEVDYIGHPLMQVLESQHGLAHPLPRIAGEKIIALLPGSRKQEILKKLPEMLSVVNDFPAYHFAIAQAPNSGHSPRPHRRWHKKTVSETDRAIDAPQWFYRLGAAPLKPGSAGNPRQAAAPAEKQKIAQQLARWHFSF